MKPPFADGGVIAIVGAESTGKTDLARTLAERLSRAGLTATRVPEYLREWCDREGRVPRPDEQSDIAREQTRRIDDAASRGVAVADTTALMTAVYSDLLFDDDSLYAEAIEAQRGYAVTLLTALDLPWVPDGLQRDGPHVREPVDTRIRAALGRAGLPFTVVHGSGAGRLNNAWRALSLGTNGSPGAMQSYGPCEKCSDPVCEHRMFTDLLARRT
jgi:nicotinamide riboside kinase